VDVRRASKITHVENEAERLGMPGKSVQKRNRLVRSVYGMG
jgi:hypothetical protein